MVYWRAQGALVYAKRRRRDNSEQITDWGKKWGESYLAHLAIEEVVGKKEILSQFKPQ